MSNTRLVTEIKFFVDIHKLCVDVTRSVMMTQTMIVMMTRITDNDNNDPNDDTDTSCSRLVPAIPNVF